MSDTNLENALMLHHAARGGQPLPAPVARACVEVLCAPSGSGLESITSSATQLLAEAAGAGNPEAKVLKLCIDGADSLEELPGIVSETVWEPIRGAAYRTLAFSGRRSTLGSLLISRLPGGLAEADAWMEAALPADAAPPQQGDRASPGYALIAAELAADSAEEILAELAREPEFASASPYADLEARLVRERARACLIRLSIARESGQYRSEMAKLPGWEGAWLRGLTEWSAGNKQLAREQLRAAYDLNPSQTCTRLALSFAIARDSPEEALSLTEHSEPTRDLLIHRAALLARLGHYGEAVDSISQAAPWEARRFSWPAGRAASMQQETLLRTALAERHGDWGQAEKIWHRAEASAQDNALREARDLFIATGELATKSGQARWARDFAERKSVRLKTRLATSVLTGHASFFRSAALIEIDRERALRDLQALGKRRAWQEREQAVGGGRLVFLGDALLRARRPEDAASVYRPISSCAERATIASVYAGLRKRAPLPELVAAASGAASSPWPKVLCALASLIDGDPAAASTTLRVAAEQGAAAPVVGRLEAVAAALSAGVPLNRDDIGVVGLPSEVAAALYLVHGGDPLPVRAAAWVTALGNRWIELCPVSPERVARSLLSAWCADSSWERALEFATELERSGQAWGREVAALTKIRHALSRALSGRLSDARDELGDIGNGIIS